MGPERSATKPPYPIEAQTIVDDGWHNGFTDLMVWQGSLWLAYIASPSHFASPRSRVVLMRSADARQWQEAARLSGGGEDIRDPKLAVIHGRLTVYALLNRAFDPAPYRTVRADSADGEHWSPLVASGPAGWLLGKPKTPDEETWFAPAHNLAEGEVRLLRSSNGLHWEPVSTIADEAGVDETAIEISPSGQLQAATRLEAGGLFGSEQAGTLLACSAPPYTQWKHSRSATTRLDGPALFSVDNIIFAVGRHQPGPRRPFAHNGSIFSRKRTSLFRLDETRLTWLTDLPSAGDTAYAGVALRGQQVVISYYTNALGRDVPWILGMLAPTSIRITVLDRSIFSNTFSRPR